MKTDKPENPPAFPAMDMNQYQGIDRLELKHEGMTLRDYFANDFDVREHFGEEGMLETAATRIMGSGMPTTPEEKMNWWIDALARMKYVYADAMLKARSTPND